MGGFTLPRASGEKVIRVWAKEDDIDDPNEIFTVELWNPSGAVLDDPVTDVPRPHHFDLTAGTVVEVIQATGAIVGPAPDPLVLSIGASDSFVDEGGTARVRVTATVANGLERAIRVPLVYSNGTAEDGDYEGAPGLWIRPGQTRGTADIAVFHDADTDDETLTVSIGELRALEAVAGGGDSFELTILDDDGAGGVEGLTVSVEDASAEEGGENLRFLVRLSQPAGSPVTVRAETSDGTARANRDYRHGFGEVRFEPGERTRTFTVWVLDDDIDEGHETLTLTLSDPDPAGVAIARGTATGTIRNSDPIPGAWLARFGRALAQQTVDSVSDRFQARREPGFEGSVPMIGLDAGAGGRGGRAASPNAPAGGGAASPDAPAGDGPGREAPRARRGMEPDLQRPAECPADTSRAGPAGMDPPLAGSGSGPAPDGGAGRCGEGPSIGRVLPAGAFRRLLHAHREIRSRRRDARLVGARVDLAVLRQRRRPRPRRGDRDRQAGRGLRARRLAGRAGAGAFRGPGRLVRRRRRRRTRSVADLGFALCRGLGLRPAAGMGHGRGGMGNAEARARERR